MKQKSKLGTRNFKGKTNSFFNSIKLTSIRTILIFYFFMLLLCSSAQDIKELNNFLSGDSPEINKLRSLAYDLQPVLYFQQNKHAEDKVDKPFMVDTDAVSIDQLYTHNADFTSIEIILIRISNPKDFDHILEISRLEAFINLKYVYFLCNYNICSEQLQKSTCEVRKIAKMISLGGNSNLIYFYLISIPS